MGAAPGPPPEITWTPATLPCNASAALVAGVLNASSVSTVPIAPESVLLCWVCYPETTTSSRRSTASAKEMLICVWFPIVTVWEENPKLEKVNCSPVDALIE